MNDNMRRIACETIEAMTADEFDQFLQQIEQEHITVFLHKEGDETGVVMIPYSLWLELNGATDGRDPQP